MLNKEICSRVGKLSLEIRDAHHPIILQATFGLNSDLNSMSCSQTQQSCVSLSSGTSSPLKETSTILHVRDAIAPRNNSNPFYEEQQPESKEVILEPAEFHLLQHLTEQVMFKKMLARLILKNQERNPRLQTSLQNLRIEDLSPSQIHLIYCKLVKLVQ